jgi:hypothetical protein
MPRLELSLKLAFSTLVTVGLSILVEDIGIERVIGMFLQVGHGDIR